jgi:hypothetical protein
VDGDKLVNLLVNEPSPEAVAVLNFMLLMVGKGEVFNTIPFSVTVPLPLLVIRPPAWASTVVMVWMSFVTMVARLALPGAGWSGFSVSAPPFEQEQKCSNEYIDTANQKYFFNLISYELVTSKNAAGSIKKSPLKEQIPSKDSSLLKIIMHHL